MVNLERVMPLYAIVYAIAYAIMNTMENLQFGKEDYFHVLDFYTGYFVYKRNGKYFFPCSHTLAIQACAPTSISRSPKLSLVFL